MRRIVSLLCVAGIAAGMSGCGYDAAVSGSAIVSVMKTETDEPSTEIIDPEQKLSEADAEAVELHKSLNEVITDMFGLDKALDVKGVLKVKYDSEADRIMVKSEYDNEWKTGYVYGCDFDKFATALKAKYPELCQLKRAEMSYMDSAFVCVALLTTDGVCGTFPEVIDAKTEERINGEENYDALYEKSMKIVML